MNEVTCGGGSAPLFIGDVLEFGRIATDANGPAGISRAGDAAGEVETAGTLKRLDQLLDIDSLLPCFCLVLKRERTKI
jgi:hypothetical protein